MNDNKLIIDNLTLYQKHLLDQMWACKTQDELTAWLDTLPTTVLQDVTVLTEVLTHELSELEELDVSQAKQYLKKFSL